MKIGFAGTGNMAAAMARGWAAAEGGPEAMLFCDLDASRAATLAAEVGGQTRAKLGELAADSDAVVLATKPGALDEAAEELGDAVGALVSVLAVTPVARLREAFPGVPVVRVMPNQPVEVRRGVLCYVPPEDRDQRLEKMLELLCALGTMVPLGEDQIDAAMAVASCSPAYVAAVADSLARAGASEGLDDERAQELVARAIAGTAELLEVRQPDAVRAAVASPGGATEAGLKALEEGGLDAAIAAAVRASLQGTR